MNLETKRPTELEELLIDAEADDDLVQHTPPVVARPWLLLLGLILVALNLRPALSSMSPLLAEVSQSLGLSAAKAGLLTTLPVQVSASSACCCRASSSVISPNRPAP